MIGYFQGSLQHGYWISPHWRAERIGCSQNRGHVFYAGVPVHLQLSGECEILICLGTRNMWHVM